jgi:hypothetical protein
MKIKGMFIKAKGLRGAPEYCHYKTYQTHAGANHQNISSPRMGDHQNKTTEL